MTDRTTIEAKLRTVLGDVLALPSVRAAALRDETPLFGAMPELDSMSAANLLGELEDRFGITIEDDEIDSEMMATFGALASYVAEKARA